MLSYALKSALTLAVLYSGFLALLSRETLHRLNRLLLLFCMATSLAVPLIHITVEKPFPFSIDMLDHSTEAAAQMAVAESDLPTGVELQVTASAVNAADTEVNTSWTDVLNHVYLSGTLLTIIVLLIRLILLARLMHGGLRHTDGLGNTVVLQRGNLPPFSAFRYIVMSVGDYERHRRTILTHEQAHIRLHHTLDLVLLEAVKAVQWFNPFVYLLGRDLRAVHEYEADEAVINQGIDAHQYQQLLVMKAVGNRLQPFANYLHRSALKQRINMMQRKKSPRWHALRAVFIVPATALALYAFATPDPDDTEILQLSSLPETVHIDLRKAVMPTNSTTVTQHFGEFQGHQHTGIDLQLHMGDTIRAAFDGKVTTVGNKPQSYGKYIILQHADDLETVYAHLSQPLVAENQEVRAGMPIGLGGNTGRSTGAHLHFETRLHGKAINPALMFDFKNHRVVGETMTIDTCKTTFDEIGVVEIDGKIITNKDELDQAHLDEENIESVNVLGPESATNHYGEKGKDGAIVIQTKQSAGDEIFSTCEELPKYNGDDAALMQLIAKHIKYPEIAQKEGVQGRVVVKFVVEKDGSVSQPQVIYAPGESTADAQPVAVTAYGKDNNQEQTNAEQRKMAADMMQAEAIRVVNLTSGQWTPGRQQGKAVRSWFTLPIVFRLN